MNLLTQETARELYAGAGRRFVHHYLSYARLHDQETQAGELANLQAAMSICRQYQWWEKLAELCGAVRFTMLDKGYWIEYRGWLELILQQAAAGHEIDKHLYLPLLDDYAELLINQGEPGEAILLYQRILETAGDQPSITSSAHFGLGVAYFASGKSEEAEAQWQLATEAAEKIGLLGWKTVTDYILTVQRKGWADPHVSIEVESTRLTPSLALWKEHLETHIRARSYFDGDDLTNAEKAYGRVIELAVQLDDQDSLSLALFHLGEIARLRDETSLALRYYQQSKKIADRLENQIGLVNIYSGMARVYMGLERYDQARPYLEAYVRLERQLGHRQALADHLFLLGYARANTGSLEESEASFQEAERLFAEVEPERVAAAARASALGGS